jgi:hypothetical protein
MPKSYKLLDDELIQEIASLPEKEQRDWLFLSPHPDFDGRWFVEALNPGFLYDFEELIGKYRTVSPAKLKAFLDYAENLEYKVAFVEDPTEILSAWEHLNDRPTFKLNSNMATFLREKGMDREAEVVEETGMLPFQLQGFNYLRNPDLKGGLALWSTGVGKTALEAALIKQHLEIDQDYDFALCVVKSNNKVDTQRKLKELGDIDAFILDRYNAEKRMELYDLFDQALRDGNRLVGITNYEKFREDEDKFIELFTNRSVVIFWDEMPTKLSNRETILYDSVRHCLYTNGRSIKWKDRRPIKLRQYDLTATPIENTPVGLFNQIRLIDPDVFPTITAWEKEFVLGRNIITHKPEMFQNLERLGLMLDFMTHQVDKKDPDIAKLFPDVFDIPVIIDWHPEHRAIYDQLQNIAKELATQAKDDPEAKAFNALQLIGVLQMLCDAPSMVKASAQNRAEFQAMLAAATTDDEYEQAAKKVSGSEAALELVQRVKKSLRDDGHTKIEKLRELVCETHKDEKIVIFSKLANYIQPVLTSYFDKWGVSYVVYRGTDKQRLEAKDKFRSDPDIQIFLSSDAGSDSIDLPEASVAIDYDLPPTGARKKQRRNRIHRVNSKHGFVTFYELRMANSVEDRWAEIIAIKDGFHDETFNGVINENAISARLSADDLWYILTGERD